MIKTETVRFLLNPVERLALEALAQCDARNMSETLRELIRTEAQRRGVWTDAVMGANGSAGEVAPVGAAPGGGGDD